MSKVLIPSLIEEVKKIPGISDLRLLDVGCGTGILTKELSQIAANVIGIDPSIKSIEIASSYTKECINVTVLKNNIKDFSLDNANKFDVIIVNMTLQTIEALEESIIAIRNILLTDGKLIFSIPHPWFYLIYREDIEFRDSGYHDEFALDLPFIISNDPDPLPSTVPYYHRPLSSYCSTLKRAGFVIDNIIEPFPDESTIKLYNNKWKGPRFLVMICSLK